MTFFFGALFFLLGVIIILFSLLLCLIGGFGMESPAVLKSRWGFEKSFSSLILGGTLIGWVGGKEELWLQEVWQVEPHATLVAQIFFVTIAVTAGGFGMYLGRSRNREPTNGRG